MINVQMLKIALQQLEGRRPPSAHHSMIVIEVPTRVDYLNDSRPQPLSDSNAKPENSIRQMQAIRFKAERYCEDGNCWWEWELDA